MSADTTESTTTPAAVTEAAPKRRGPKSRAEIEAEIREQIEAETRAKVEAEIREQVEAEVRAKVAADATLNPADATPISGADVDGDPTQQGSITVHFVEDGLTLLGKIWYRGEELTINPGTDNWAQASNVLVMDEYEQESKWGQRFFRNGPWRGKSLMDIDMSEMDDEQRRQLIKAQKRHEERYGAR